MNNEYATLFVFNKATQFKGMKTKGKKKKSLDDFREKALRITFVYLWTMTLRCVTKI